VPHAAEAGGGTNPPPLLCGSTGRRSVDAAAASAPLCGGAAVLATRGLCFVDIAAWLCASHSGCLCNVPVRPS